MDKPANLIKNQPVKLYSGYNTQRDQYLRNQGNQHQRPRNHHNQSHVTTKVFAQSVEVNQMTQEEIQARLNETRGAQAAAFAAPRNKVDSSTFNVF